MSIYNCWRTNAGGMVPCRCNRCGGDDSDSHFSQFSHDSDDHGSDDSDDDEEVEFMAVVPVGDPVPEAVDVTELSCPICFREFNNGEGVIVLSCGGFHVLCKECHGAIGVHDRQAAVLDNLTGAEVSVFDAVRRAEGADKCPVCRRMSHCATEARAWSRLGSKNNAINVDGE